jgi:hypothetical protein
MLDISTLKKIPRFARNKKNLLKEGLSILKDPSKKLRHSEPCEAMPAARQESLYSLHLPIPTQEVSNSNKIGMKTHPGYATPPKRGLAGNLKKTPQNRVVILNEAKNLLL